MSKTYKKFLDVRSEPMYTKDMDANANERNRRALREEMEAELTELRRSGTATPAEYAGCRSFYESQIWQIGMDVGEGEEL